MTESLTSLDDDLERLHSLPRDEVMSYLDKKLPTLLECLKDCQNDPADAVKSSCILFDHCLQCCESISKAEKLFLCSALPLLNQLFEEIYSGISKQVEAQIFEVVDGLLQVLITLVGCTKNCVQFYSNFEKIPAADMELFNTSVMPLVLKAVDHCSNSKIIYQSFAETLADELACFTREVGDLMTRLVLLYKDVVTFDPVEREYEIVVLCAVAEFFGEIGTFSHIFNVRIMTECWKMFSSLTGTHSDCLVQILKVDVPVSYLCKEILRLKKSAVEEETDEKTAERILKVASFLLRLLVNLLESGYSKSLRGSVENLVQLIVSLQKSSEQVLKITGEKVSRSEMVNRQLVIGVSSLVSALVDHKRFSEIIYNSLSKSKMEPVSELLLVSTILQEAANCSPEARSHWIAPDENLLKLQMELIEECPFSLAQVSSDLSEAIYEACLSSSCTFGVSMTADEFLVVEKTLLSTLCSSPSTPWPWILASDLWVCLVRSAGPALCLEHIKLLRSIKMSMPDGPQQKMISTLEHRLTQILPQASVSAIEVTLTQYEVHKVTIKALQQIVSQPSQNSFCECLSALDLIIAKKPHNQLLTPLLQLLPFCQDGGIGEQFGIKVLEALVLYADEMDNQQLETVLTQFPFLLPASLRIKSIKFISILSSRTLAKDGRQPTVIRLISEAFNDLLQNFNPVVREFALKAFATFAHCSPHEEVVPMAVVSSKELQTKVSTYIQKSACPSRISAFEELRRLAKIRRPTNKEFRVDFAEKVAPDFGSLNDDDFFDLEDDELLLETSQRSDPQSPTRSSKPEEIVLSDGVGSSQEPAGFSSDLSQMSAREDEGEPQVFELTSLVNSLVKTFKKERLCPTDKKKIRSAIVKLQGILEEAL